MNQFSCCDPQPGQFGATNALQVWSLRPPRPLELNTTVTVGWSPRSNLDLIIDDSSRGGYGRYAHSTPVTVATLTRLPLAARRVLFLSDGIEDAPELLERRLCLCLLALGTAKGGSRALDLLDYLPTSAEVTWPRWTALWLGHSHAGAVVQALRRLDRGREELHE